MFVGIIDLPWWGYVVTALILTHITIASVTIFLHRHQAHRALDLHSIPSHFFRFWLWLTTGVVTKEWAAIHRKHHAKCETEEDPHSPVILGIGKVLREGAELYQKEAKNLETLNRYGHGTPDDWLERNIYGRHDRPGIVLMLAINIVLFGPLGLTIWAVQMAWIPVNAAGIINGLGHYFGYRNFACADASTNIIPWGIFIGGEELHNNHHTYPTSAKLSNKWYEFDIGWMYICILSFFGLAKVKKVAPTPKFAEPRSVVDQANLQAVIAHRYDVMAKYAASVRRVYGEEVARLRTVSADRVKLVRIETARKWLNKDAEQLSDVHRASLREALTHSQALTKVYEMRLELASIWKRSSHTADQLLVLLQDWCKRAEESGVHALQDFSLRLRSYS